MEIEPIRQISLDGLSAERFGDRISALLEEEQYTEFKFCVAYMRESGITRLNTSIREFREKGGEISGVVGVGNGITSLDSLKSLQEVSENSTVYNTISNLEFHPKCYLFEGDESGVVIQGSANLTRDGLFRNVEMGSKITFDLSEASERSLFMDYRQFLDELLNDSNPNVQPINDSVLSRLEDLDLVEIEGGGGWSGGTDTPSSGTEDREEIESLFPTVDTPSTPSPVSLGGERSESADDAKAFVMQLSASDSSHRSGTEGTPMVLIPKDAVSFFPELTEEGSTDPPDAYFDVRLNTSDGHEVQEYRFWHYEEKEEFRFRVKNEAIDLTSKGGGDLIVVSKADDEDDFEFEVTIIGEDDPGFDRLLGSCEHDASGKIWGFVE